MAESSSNKRPKLMDAKANVLMVGTGEYTTGYVGGTASDSDKGAGVVALTMFDLRRRGKVERVGMCGVNVGNYLFMLLILVVVVGYGSDVGVLDKSIMLMSVMSNHFFCLV